MLTDLNFYSTKSFLLLCWVGVHCGIYKSSYNISNISYLNSPSPPFSFISPLPPFLKWFQQVSFCMYIHVHTFFGYQESISIFERKIKLTTIMIKLNLKL
jgi:hypothetical protein